MITVLYTYFGQKERIPQIVEQGVNTIIVDDCSNEPLLPIDGIKILRIIDNIIWNEAGAKNLGFQESEGWIVCCDIDHLITYDIVNTLEQMKKEIGCVYFLGRHDTFAYNTYMIHKDDFNKIGGYDEDFCGYYGYNDIHFFKKCKNSLKIVELRELKASVFPESASKGVSRDYSRNKKLFDTKGTEETKRIRFNWKYVN